MVKIESRQLLANAGYWLGLPLLVTLLGFMPGKLITHSSLLLCYLSTVLVTSLRADRSSVLAAALTGFLLFNFFHTQPRFSFLMHAGDELISALVFIVFALVSGGIAGRLKHQLQLLQEQKEFFGAQVNFYHRVQGINSSEDLPAILQEMFGDLFRGQVSFEIVGEGTSACALAWHSSGPALGPDHETMLLSLREQVQSVLQRIAADKALKVAERQSDEEQLRSALLSSVSHDLKTPLVTMLGAATSLRDLRQDLSQKDAADLLDSIITESQRLESYIQNLLDMTRLGHGGLSLSRDWVSVEEIYHVVTRRIARMVPEADISLQITEQVPALYVHAALIEQGLFNVIDNAMKAGGKNRPIAVLVDATDSVMHIRICDQGPGLPQAEWQAVFDPFHTFSLGDCYEKGTGLGLSICRSIFRVHGGEAEIVAAPGGFNHCVMLSLPLLAEGRIEEGEE